MIYKENFCVNISNISLLNKIASDVFYVQDVAWNVYARKNFRKGKEFLGICFVQKENSENCSQPVIVTFKLLSFNDGIDPLEYHCEPYFSNHTGLSIDKLSLIPWENLVDINKGYVKNDAINLEVTIEIAELDEGRNSEFTLDIAEAYDESDGNHSIRFSITNIDNLVAVRSPIFEIQQLYWDLTIYKSHSNTLNVRFGSIPCYRKIRYLANGHVRVKLLSSNGDKNSIEKMKNGRFDNFRELHEFELISWEQLINTENGFVNNNSIAMEVEIQRSKSERCRSGGSVGFASEASKMKCFICLVSIEGESIASSQRCHPLCSICKKQYGCFSI